MKNTSAQSGNILLYLLIAIALIAILTAVMSRGSRTNQSMLSDQQAKVAAQEIIDYGNTVAHAVQTLKLRGCTDTQISFENAAIGINYTNPNAPTDGSCHVFKSNGGNLTYVDPPSVAYSEYYAASSYKYGFFGNYNIEGVGTSARDLIFFLTSIKLEVCNQIASVLSQADPASGGNENTGAPVIFQGAYGAGTGDDVIGNDSGTYLDGHTSGCIYNNAGLYAYYQVLIAR